MATADLSRSKRRSAKTKTTAEAKPRSRAFRNGCVLMLLGMLTTVCLAPTIVAYTPLAPWLVESALTVDGSVTLGSVSLGWFSGIEVSDLEIRDSEHEPVLSIARLHVDKTLTALLLNSSDLGRVTVEQPTLRIVARKRSTNLEDVLAPLLVDAGSARVDMRLQITEGRVLFEDAYAERAYRLENLDVDCTLAADESGLALTSSADLVDERQPGKFKLDIKASPSAHGRLLANGQLVCQAQGLPLELIEPWVRRHVSGAQLTGRLTTELDGAWGDQADAGQGSIRGQSVATGVVFTADALGDDRIELARVELPCRVVQDGETVEIEQVGLHCELGELTLSGSAAAKAFAADDLPRSLSHQRYELKGHLDLAPLAAMLRSTLRIRPGTDITSGQLTLAINSQVESGDLTLIGRVDATQLRGNAGGRAVSWDKPLAVQFVARDTRDGVVLDSAHCASEFLQIEAAGSLDDLTASASFDLKKLITQLRQFADLDDIQLDGSGQGQLAWKRGDKNHFSAKGEFQARSFQFTIPGNQPWTENQVVAHLDIAGQLDAQHVRRFDAVRLSIEAGSEKLSLELADGEVEHAAETWPLHAHWQGQLAHWAPRFEAVLGVKGWNLAGAGSAQALLICSTEAVDIRQAKADLTQVRISGNDWFVAEPALTVGGEARWDRKKMQLDVATAKLVAGESLLQLERGVAQHLETGWALDGLVKLSADLEQLYRWRHDPRTRPAWQVSGRMMLDGELKQRDGATTGRADGSIEQLQVVDLARAATAGAAASSWREAHIALAVRGGYHHADSQLRLDQVRLASAALACDAAGHLPLSAQGGDINLKGTIQYDWDKLAPLWGPLLGDDVEIVGRQTRPFTLAGRLAGDLTDSRSWRQVRGELALGWSGMSLHGVPVGPGEIDALLADGQLRAKPIDVIVSRGRLTAAPIVRLDPGPAELILGSGPILTGIYVTRDLCARNLRFMAPILSDASIAEGVFSVSIDGGRLPLANPSTGDISGRVAMRAQVRSAPVANELRLILSELTTILQRGKLARRTDQSGSILSIDDSDIEFRMVGGRVYHRNLTIKVGNTPMTTHGSVGFDESLAIVAEVPMQAKILGVDLSLGTLEGQTLQIPIQGTLANPQVDRRIVQQVASKMIGNAARGVLLDEFGKHLDKLLPHP